MTYYVCTACPQQRHTTLDHEMNAPRPCLLCGCKGMVDGEPFIKPKKEFSPSFGQGAKFTPKEFRRVPAKVLEQEPGLGTEKETTSQG